MSAQVGILGTGQLGLMLGEAGDAIDATCRCFGPDADPPAARSCAHVRASFDDLDALSRFAEGLGVITWEWENVPRTAVEHVAQRVPVYPPPDALSIAQDRLLEKQLFTRLGIDCPGYQAIDDEAGLARAAAALGMPFVVKTRRGGYDGKGQAIVRTGSDLVRAWRDLGAAPGGLIAESFVPFEREVSMLLARSRSGAVQSYPLVQNRHADGILRTSLAPASDPEGALEAQARRAAEAIAGALAYVGVLAVEFFVMPVAGGSALLANEIAPRVHNSGHWTIEGSKVSQFENHLRAILGLPLGSAAMHDAAPCAGMVNLIGAVPDADALAAIADAHVHFYGKAPRMGRKLGHVTVTASSPAQRNALLERVEGVVRASAVD